ncbi:MAG TPA: phenylalanine--tRNA ligase subunit alpha [Candidatus Limnocylindrales bacterium]|nr:phenylalanine--tRNA ligase subunit alpha [Candidatus Limnocylindrales bacterium]
MDLADLTRDLEALRDDALGSIAATDDVAALEALEVDILGKKGRLTTVLRGIGALPPDDRPRVGAVANAVRGAIEGALAERGAQVRGAALTGRLAEETLDVTTPGRPIRRGSLHPSIEAMGEIAEIFGQFGFVVYESPEIEDDLTNFQMLNIPPDHPARDLWDTLYLDVEGRLLRTHTSPGQIHVMRSTPPPIRAILPGRCFRYEAIDASHATEFFQVEGLMVDEGTTMADLKGLLDQFARAMYGADKKTRFRPGYYPFTEPSVAFDIECLVCGGPGCPACGRTGWMTILGAGMVHPVVLQYGGLDPERYQGFAFGMGPERIKMLKHGITDIRLFLDDDLRFLDQFR